MATRRVLAWISLAGPLIFIGLTIVLGLTWQGYDPVRDTMSVLGAVDSPVGTVMNVMGFMGIGISILAFAGAYATTFRGRLALVAVALLVVAGAGMTAVGFFPCDSGCADLTDTGRMHSLLSAPGAIGLPAAAMVSAAVFRHDGRLGTAWQVTSFALGLITLASGPVIAAEVIHGLNGLLQRAAMWPALIWMAAVSARLLTVPALPAEALSPVTSPGARP